MNSDHGAGEATHFGKDAPTAHAADSHPTGEANGSGAEANGMEALLRESDYAIRSVRRGETVEGTVVRVDEDEVLVDIGLKSEGVIPARELYSEDEEAEPLKIGDKTLVYVVHPEGSEGHAILSLRRARTERSWREIEDLFHRGAIIEAPVIDYNKGGLIVDVKGVRGFVPVSQALDLRNVARQEGENEEVTQTLAAMSGRKLPLKIIEINRSRNRLILSERSAVQEQRSHRKDELLEQLEPGQIRRGVVSNLTSFGAFVDLGGADGLVHVSELSYNRVNHPSEILQVGQEVDVAVLSVDRDNKKIALSLKQAAPDPWTNIEEQYHLGQVVSATITKLAKFGAFAKVGDGLEGLIHLTELTDQPIQDPSEVVHEGQEVEAKIIHINSQRRRLGLSVRQAIEPSGKMQTFGELEEESPFASQMPAALQDVEASTAEETEQPSEEVEAASEISRLAVDDADSSDIEDSFPAEADEGEAAANFEATTPAVEEAEPVEPAMPVQSESGPDESSDEQTAGPEDDLAHSEERATSNEEEQPEIVSVVPGSTGSE